MKTSQTTKSTFTVINMKCAGCASSIESILKSQNGVEEVSINLEEATATVEYNSELITKAQLKAAVQSIGYDIDINV